MPVESNVLDRSNSTPVESKVWFKSANTISNRSEHNDYFILAYFHLIHFNIVIFQGSERNSEWHWLRILYTSLKEVRYAGHCL